MSSFKRSLNRFGFRIDMDGVLYRGPEVIAGADRFIREIRDREIPFRLLTNNSQRTPRDVVARLVRMGLGVEKDRPDRPATGGECSRFDIGPGMGSSKWRLE